MSDQLQAIRMTGFASLADVELRPGRLTVLIGPNGSGKSNILRALRMIPLMRTGSLSRFVAESGGAASLLHYGPKKTQAMTLDLQISRDEQRNHYRARLGFAAGDRLMFLDEQVGFQATPEAPVRTDSLGAGHWESQLRSAKATNITAKTVNYWLSQVTFFHFHDTSMTSQLRTQSRAEDDQFLRSDGSNLAAYLGGLERSEAISDQKAWRRINRLVRRIAPAIKTLAPTLNAGGTSVRLDWIDDQDERFGAHHLSDGTLRAIALVTALAQPTSKLPKFMSIDEPELGLHPAAITLLAELARSVSRHTQVLFATQSTTFLNHFNADEVVVVERHDGATSLSRPDPQSLANWLEDYSLAEIFDKGVIGGCP